MKLRICTLTAALIAGTSAIADNIAEPIDATTPQPTSSTPSDWTGFYAGHQYVIGNAGDTADTFDTDGFGTHGGYLQDMGSFVYGGEVDFDALDVDASRTISRIIAMDVFRLKGIVGYDAGNFMPYLTAGAAYVDIDTGFSDIVGFYGIGGRYKINETVSLGLEYTIIDVSDIDGGGPLEAELFSLRTSFNF